MHATKPATHASIYKKEPARTRPWKGLLNARIKSCLLHVRTPGPGLSSLPNNLSLSLSLSLRELRRLVVGDARAPPEGDVARRAAVAAGDVPQALGDRDLQASARAESSDLRIIKLSCRIYGSSRCCLQDLGP